MKRISDLLKPFLSVIFGALLFLCYFNWLAGEEGTLAIGIIAVTLAVYYVTVGILGSCLGDKFNSKTKAILDECGVAAFPLFLGVSFLVNVIEWGDGFGPMGWTIAIFSIGASFALGVLFLIAFFTKKHFFIRASFLFSCLFVLALLLNVLIDSEGNPERLGNIVILFVVLYGVYSFMLFNELKVLQQEYKSTPKKEVTKEEPAKEEK